MRCSIHMVAGAERFVDAAGAEYADLAAARAEAVRSARELVADWLRNGAIPDGAIEIIDEAGQIRESFTLHEAVFGLVPRERHRQVYNTVDQNYLLLTPDLTILEANRAYLAATLTDLVAISRRFVFDVFPDNPGDPNADGVRNLTASLTHVLRHKTTHRMPRQRYDIRTRNGVWLERHWEPVNYPVLNHNGEVEFIIHQAADVTRV